MARNAENANREFTASYEFDGETWTVSVWAATFEEAEMKLAAMGRGKVDGFIEEIIPLDNKCPTCGRGEWF